MDAASSSSPPQDARHARLMTAAARASVAVALILIVAKLWAWRATGSVTLMASLLDSLLDAFTSIITLLAVRYSLQPPDEEHRFGHGKAEAIAGLAQAAFIMGSAVAVLWNAADRFIHPRELEHTGLGIGVMLLSMVLTSFLVLFQRYAIRISGSTAIEADSLHYVGDLLANAGVIVALLLEARGVPYADAVAGLLTGILIIRSAWQIISKSLDMLLDHELPAEVTCEFAGLVRCDKRILGFHDLKTRQSGTSYFFQLHIEVDGSLPLRQAHDIAEALEQRVVERWPGSECLVHLDPRENYPVPAGI
ncbi:MAG: hypothetical protein RL095_1899 [Verrucomicrobiota bacterium]|jgi:ferrous-iron efflux pump FieF